MTERHSPFCDPHPGRPTAWHPADGEGAVRCSAGTTVGTGHSTGSRRPEED